MARVERERRGEIVVPGTGEVAAPDRAARVGHQVIEPAERGRDVVHGAAEPRRVGDVGHRGGDGDGSRAPGARRRRPALRRPGRRGRWPRPRRRAPRPPREPMPRLPPVISARRPCKARSMTWLLSREHQLSVRPTTTAGGPALAARPRAARRRRRGREMLSPSGTTNSTGSTGCPAGTGTRPERSRPGVSRGRRRRLPRIAAPAAFRSRLAVLRACFPDLPRAARSRLAALRALALALRALPRRRSCSCAADRTSHPAASPATRPHSRSSASHGLPGRRAAGSSSPTGRRTPQPACAAGSPAPSAPAAGGPQPAPRSR